MGLMGFSIIVASGDSGTGNNGIFSCKKFQPQFPASSPYVTSVGGTYLDPSSQQEIAVSFSGGGFSDRFAAPSYQQQAIAEYLKTQSSSLPPPQYWNASGRGIPDVSALSTNFQVVIEKYLGSLSGTSAATPTFAAIVALVNGIREQKTLPPLGFLNPALYLLKGGVGTDITQGSNPASFCPSGFQAAPGWDPISGLGTPFFPWLVQELGVD